MNKLEKVTEVFKRVCEEVKTIMNDSEEKKVQLSELEPGDRFNTELGKFIVLGHENGVTKVLQDDFFAEDVGFDDKSCDYTKSALKKMFDEKIEPEYRKVFGDGLMEHEVELKSVDVQDYGKFKCKARPITFDEAREYNSLIVKENIGEYWWTCTPWSTEKRGWKYSVSVVSPSGSILDVNYYFSSGVRPFCILKSNIFVSKED